MEFENGDPMPSSLTAWINDKIARTDGRQQLGTVLIDESGNILESWPRTPQGDILREKSKVWIDRGRDITVYDLQINDSKIYLKDLTSENNEVVFSEAVEE